MPSPQQVKNLAEALAGVDVDELARKLLLAMRRDTGASSKRDGFGAGGLSGGGPATVLHCFTHERDNCPCGQNTTISVASDPTGNAAAAGAAAPDKLHVELEHAIAHLDRVVYHLHGLKGRLLKIDGLADDSDLEPPPGCTVMQRVNVWEPVHRTTTVDTERIALGQWAYKFLGTNGRLPTDAEAEQHALGKKVHVRRG